MAHGDVLEGAIRDGFNSERKCMHELNSTHELKVVIKVKDISIVPCLKCIRYGESKDGALATQATHDYEQETHAYQGRSPQQVTTS